MAWDLTIFITFFSLIFGYEEINRTLQGINQTLSQINGPKGLLQQYLDRQDNPVRKTAITHQLLKALTDNDTDLNTPIGSIGASITFLKAATNSFAQINRIIQCCRPGSITKVQDGFYTGKQTDPAKADLTFCMVRLTDENLPIWQAFADDQSPLWEEAKKRLIPLVEKNVELPTIREIKQRNKKGSPLNESEKILLFLDRTNPFAGGNSGIPSIKDGLIAFKESLSIYEEFHSEIWIAYVLSGRGIDTNTPVKKEIFPNIEMIVTVLTSPEAPFVVHMGIARTVYNELESFEGRLPKHKELAIPLHTFAACAMKGLYPYKIWMYTSPTHVMGKILAEAMAARGLPPPTPQKKTNELISPPTDPNLTIHNKDGDVILHIVDWKKNHEWDFFKHMNLISGGGNGPCVIDLNVLASLF